MVLDMSGYHALDSNENLKRADRKLSAAHSTEDATPQRSRKSSEEESSEPSSKLKKSRGVTNITESRL